MTSSHPLILPFAYKPSIIYFLTLPSLLSSLKSMVHQYNNSLISFLESIPYPFLILLSLYLPSKIPILNGREGNNMSLPNMLLWHIDYFKLKAFKQQMQERHSNPPFTSWKKKTKLLWEKYLPSTWRKEDVLIKKWRL